MSKFASLCILGWKRPEMLINCIDSIHQTLDYPAEIIVSIDGEEEVAMEERAAPIVSAYFNTKKISKLLICNGLNRGVGRSFQNCLGVAEGDYIFKIDSDLTFHPQWLSRAVHALENNLDVAAISLFNYRNYDPKDERFNILEERSDCAIVDDFVSSIYGFRKESLWRITENLPVPDDGVHTLLADDRLLKNKLNLAITKKDYVINSGFGLNSVYLTFDDKGTPSKTETHTNPLIFS